MIKYPCPGKPWLRHQGDDNSGEHPQRARAGPSRAQGPGASQAPLAQLSAFSPPVPIPDSPFMPTLFDVCAAQTRHVGRTDW